MYSKRTKETACVWTEKGDCMVERWQKELLGLQQRRDMLGNFAKKGNKLRSLDVKIDAVSEDIKNGRCVVCREV